MIYREKEIKLVDYLLNKYTISSLSLWTIPALYYYYKKFKKQSDEEKNKFSNINEGFKFNEISFNTKGLSLSKVSRGLINTGNNCFLNSVLQAYSSLPNLVYYLRKLELNCSSQLSFDFINELLNTIFKLNLNNSNDAVDPENLVDILSIKMNDFKYFIDQQDCHELIKTFNLFLEKTIKEILNIDDKDSKANEHQKKFEFPFKGENISTFYCKECNTKEKSKIEEFDDISLNIKMVMSDNLEKIIDYNFKPEILEKYCKNCSINFNKSSENNQFFEKLEKNLEIEEIEKLYENEFNNKFKKLNKFFEKRTEIKKYPNILILHLQQLTMDNYGNMVNLKKRIDFKETLKLNNTNYKLRSYICHIGNYNNGHYITIKNNWISTNPFFNNKIYFKTPVNEKFINWNFISDQKILQLENYMFQHYTPYLLFYEKIE